MESHVSTQIKVGIFLTIGLFIILASIFFLGADKALFTSYVRVHAHFEQVQGLAVGSVVSLSGVTVGNVETITFLPEKNALNVQMKINENYIDRIRQGSEVEIRTQGALGDKFIFIIPGDPRAGNLKEGDILQVAKPTDLFGIIAERGNETSKLFDIINELHKITAAMNIDGRMVRIMNNMETASASFAKASQDSQKVMSQIATSNGGEKLTQSLDRLDSILGKIDRGEGSLGALINDPTLHNRLKSLLGGTNRKGHVESLLRTSIQKETKD